MTYSTLSLSLSLSRARAPVKVPGLKSPPNTLIGLRGVRNEYSASKAEAIKYTIAIRGCTYTLSDICIQTKTCFLRTCQIVPLGAH